MIPENRIGSKASRMHAFVLVSCFYLFCFFCGEGEDRAGILGEGAYCKDAPEVAISIINCPSQSLAPKLKSQAGMDPKHGHARVVIAANFPNEASGPSCGAGIAGKVFLHPEWQFP